MQHRCGCEKRRYIPLKVFCGHSETWSCKWYRKFRKSVELISTFSILYGGLFLQISFLDDAFDVKYRFLAVLKKVIRNSQEKQMRSYLLFLVKVICSHCRKWTCVCVFGFIMKNSSIQWSVSTRINITFLQDAFNTDFL